MNRYTINGYKRITRAAAFKAYKDGITVYFCPVKLRPGAPYNPETAIQCNTPRKWENIINEFIFYNCNNETGKYIAFYIQEDITI